MDFIKLAKNRYSVRKFSDKKVEQEKINLILEAGRLAPTAVNKQPQRILVINEIDILDRLKECTPYHFNAPLAILICYDKTASWTREHDNSESGLIDASIVASHMMLEIADIGLGTTWVGHFDPIKIQKIFKLPETFVPVALFPIGYPSDNSKPSHLHDKRLSLSETVFFNQF